MTRMEDDADGVVEERILGNSLIVVELVHMAAGGQERTGVRLVGVAGLVNRSPAVLGQQLKALGEGLLAQAGVPSIVVPGR